MKTLGSFLSALAMLVGSLVLGFGPLVCVAAPGGPGGQPGAANGTGAGSSSAPTSGGRSGGGASRAANSAPAGRPAFTGSVLRSPGASGAGTTNPSRFSSSSVNSGSPRYLPGGIQPNVSGVQTSRVRSNPALATNRAAATSRPVTATQQPVTTPQGARSFTSTQPGNAWTDARSLNNRPASRRARADLNNRSAGAYRNYISNGNHVGLTTPDGFTGSVLYPGAYGSALNSYYDALAPRGALAGNRQVTNYARIQRWYGRDGRRYRYWPNGYYPYFGVSSYPFFGGYGYGDSIGGTYNGDNAINTNPPLNNVDQSIATVEDNQPTADAPNPASVETNREAPTGTLGAGPDSLVEAVQAELARRGYFEGKVDAVYGPTTKEALRRFQTDRKLTVTGRVNEATLHALELD